MTALTQLFALAGIKATRQAQEQLFNELDPNMDGVLDYKVNPRSFGVILIDLTRRPLPLLSASQTPSPSTSLSYSCPAGRSLSRAYWATTAIWLAPRA